MAGVVWQAPEVTCTLTPGLGAVEGLGGSDSCHNYSGGGGCGSGSGSGSRDGPGGDGSISSCVQLSQQQQQQQQQPPPLPLPRLQWGSGGNRSGGVVGSRTVGRHSAGSGSVRSPTQGASLGANPFISSGGNCSSSVDSGTSVATDPVRTPGMLGWLQRRLNKNDSVTMRTAGSGSTCTCASSNDGRGSACSNGISSNGTPVLPMRITQYESVSPAGDGGEAARSSVAAPQSHTAVPVAAALQHTPQPPATKRPQSGGAALRAGQVGTASRRR